MANKDDDILSDHLNADGDIDSVIDDITSRERIKELMAKWATSSDLKSSESSREQAKAEIKDSAVRAAQESSPTEPTLEKDATDNSPASSDASAADESVEQPESDETDADLAELAAPVKTPAKPILTEHDLRDQKLNMVSDPEFSRNVIEQHIPTVKVVKHEIVGAYVVRGSRTQEEIFTDLYANRPKLDDAEAIQEQIEKLELAVHEHTRAALRGRAELTQLYDDLDKALPKATREVKDRIIARKSESKAKSRKAEKDETTPANKPIGKKLAEAVDMMIGAGMSYQVVIEQAKKTGKLTNAVKQYIDMKFKVTV